MVNAAQGCRLAYTGDTQMAKIRTTYRTGVLAVLTLADQNPIYISDVEYYASVLAEAQRCAKNLSTMATVSR